MKLVLSVLAFILTALATQAQETFNSMVSGKWSSPASWDMGRVPSQNDIIVIHSGHTIEVDHNISLSNITLRILGNLRINNGKTLLLNSSSIINVLSGGQLYSETGHPQSMISMDGMVKYRGNKIFNQTWGEGIVRGVAYATGTSGNIDQAGHGFILGKFPAIWQDFGLFRTPDNHVQMVWVTSHETGIRIFEIEKSTDASNWKIIGTIRSAGNLSPQNIYSYVDHQPGKGMNFYRVKHLNPDGNYVYSAVRVMKMNDKFSAGNRLYPNPALNYTLLSLEKETTEPVRLILYNVNGQTMKQIPLPKGTTNYPVDLTGIPSGMYRLQLVYPHGEQQSFHLVKH